MSVSVVTKRPKLVAVGDAHSYIARLESFRTRPTVGAGIGAWGQWGSPYSAPHGTIAGFSRDNMPVSLELRHELVPDEYSDLWGLMNRGPRLDYLVTSYLVPIAWYVAGDGWTHNTKTYSLTTTSHQHAARYGAYLHTKAGE